MRKKILISAYAISPTRGSEYGAAWNTVTHLAKHHDLWVLYGMSDDHMGDTQTINKYLSDNYLPAVKFIKVAPGKGARAINTLNKAGLGWFFYFAYYLWQRSALETALEIVQTVDIDVVHQLGPIGFREPGFLGELDKPLVWGPIGGMRLVDNKLFKHKPVFTRLQFLTKNAINQIQLKYTTRIKDAFSRADVLISATVEGKQTIKKLFNKGSYHLSEMMVTKIHPPAKSKFVNMEQQVQLVWSGSHIERKNLELCLAALAATEQNNWVLNVLGIGPLTGKLKARAAALRLEDKIIWHGHLPKDEAIKIMADSHLHILTSIAEDNPSVIVEALSYGVPTLAIDHSGMSDVICNKCGIKIMPGEHTDMVKNMAVILSHILKNTKILEGMANTTLMCAASYQWEKRLTKLNAIYKEAITTYEKRLDHSFNNDALTMI